MEGGEYIPLGFLGVIHRGSGSVTFQEHDCRLARGWLEAVTLLYIYTSSLSHPASDTRGFSRRVNGRGEPRSSLHARINIAGCVRPRSPCNREKSCSRNNKIEFENTSDLSLEIYENLGISSETSLLKTGGLLNETSDSNGRGGKRVGKSGC